MFVYVCGRLRVFVYVRECLRMCVCVCVGLRRFVDVFVYVCV